MAKIHWTPKKSEEAPPPTTVPGALHDVDFMVRDGKRFPDTGAWGYAEFDYDAVVRRVHTRRDRYGLRIRVPYDRDGEGLCFHGLPEKVTGVAVAAAARSDGGSSVDAGIPSADLG